MTEQQILSALSTVIEPDLHRDLVTLNMIKNLRVEGNQVSFTIELTTPACPLKEKMKNDCLKAIAQVFPEAAVQVDFSANVTARVASAVLPHVKNTIAVASGKGGVGKSTVSANLALALAQSGAKVGLVDVDIYGPSVPTMFGALGERPMVNDERKIIPIEKFGVKLLSMGFLMDADQAAIWRGSMVTSAVRQFLQDTEWGDLDYLVIDLPPGTGDIQLTLVQTLSLTGAVLVSTPQEVALADAKRGLAMFEKVNVPILGIVENMAYFSPPDMPEKKYYLFGEGGAKALATTRNVPFLGEIPIEQATREGGDEGLPILLKQPESLSAKAFVEIAKNTAQQIAIHSMTA